MIHIESSEILSRGYHLLRRIRFSWPGRDGGRSSALHEVLERADAAAILLHHRERDVFVLVSQYRLGAALNGHEGPLLEVAAGLIDAGETPLEAALRETREETGYAPAAATPVCAIFPSPAAVTEKLFLFVAEIDDGMRVGAGGGLAHEEEEVAIREIGVAQARAMLDAGEIADAKTLILLQWYFARADAAAANATASTPPAQ